MDCLFAATFVVARLMTWFVSFILADQGTLKPHQRQLYGFGVSCRRQGGAEGTPFQLLIKNGVEVKHEVLIQSDFRVRKCHCVQSCLE